MFIVDGRMLYAVLTSVEFVLVGAGAGAGAGDGAGAGTGVTISVKRVSALSFGSPR
jgi:hypothetical protein